MPTAGTDATKASVVSEFNTTVIAAANAGTVYNLSGNPFTYAGYPAYAAAYLSNTPAQDITAGDITASDLVASGLASALYNFALASSRIRDTQFWFNCIGCTFLGSGKTILNSAYQALVNPPGAPVASTDASGTALSTYITALNTNRAATEASTVQLLACHSSCHSSCHGARGRR